MRLKLRSRVTVMWRFKVRVEALPGTDS